MFDKPTKKYFLFSRRDFFLFSFYVILFYECFLIRIKAVENWNQVEMIKIRH